MYVLEPHVVAPIALCSTFALLRNHVMSPVSVVQVHTSIHITWTKWVRGTT